MLKSGWQSQAFNSLINYSQAVIICLSDDGSIVEFNPVAEALFGWRYAEVVGVNFFTLCQTQGLISPSTALQEIAQSGNFEEKICTIKSKNGEIKIIHWNSFPFMDKEENKVLLLGIDKTAYEVQSESNKKLNSYLHNIINNLPHYIFWKDCNSRFIGCNKKFSDSVHLNAPEDIVGKTDRDMPWGKYADKYAQDDSEVIESGVGKLNFEEPHIDGNGKEMVVLVSKVPMYDSDQKIIGLLGIYTDITERKQQEESLRVAKEASETANQLKRDFISNMEHDIRTPFSGIYAMIDVLIGMETDSEKKQYLIDIQNCSKELLEYSNAILNFSKLESGLLPHVSKKFNIKKLIEGVMAIETPPAKVKNVNLFIECDNDVPQVIIGDPYRLQRVLINLVSNAVKFTQEGYVKVIVKFASQEDKQKCVLRIIIEDTGIGIPLEKQNYIYEKFIRLIPSNRGAYKGSGLGLPIVKQLMDELEGELDVKSEPNKGTIFICTLPFKLPLINEILFEDNNHG